MAVRDPIRPTHARRSLADTLSAVGVLVLALATFTHSSYNITALALGLCVVGGFLRIG